MGKTCFLGVDTSNYTTSLAAVDPDFHVIANLKMPLRVAEGEHGLRQSDALFSHIKNLPELSLRLREVIEREDLTPLAIGVSTRPRNRDGSYMPCFLAGEASASAAAAVSRLPLFRFSHQCGHIMAAIVSSRRFDLLDKPFYAFHVSGGTTELLAVERSGDGFLSEIVGGTKDLNAGQIVDRVGVSLGVPFPAGPGLEKLALSYTDKVPKRKAPVSDGFVNLSGLENLAGKLYREEGDPALVASFVFSYLTGALVSVVGQVMEKCGSRDLLCAGGVMSSVILRREMEAKFGASFAEPMLSADNAVGVAALTARAYRNGGGVIGK